MNRNSIVNYFLKVTDSNTTKENYLIEAIEEAKLDMEAARSVFDNVSDFHLVELAIYSEEVAKKRYDYLIALAKEMGVRASKQYIIDQCYSLAEWLRGDV